MSIQSLIAELNESQRTAAQLQPQHALVLAGAGCGKTKTIVARAAWLIATGSPADRIQILTSTQQAAEEIVNAVRASLGETAADLKGGTFHHWCVQMLRKAPEIFGSPGDTIIDRPDQISLLKRDFGKEINKFGNAGNIFNRYSRARNGCQSLKVDFPQGHPEQQQYLDMLTTMISAYEQRKKEFRYYDCDDILTTVARRMADSSDVCRWVGEQLDHILVDDVQDVNPLQWTLLTPLQDCVHLFCAGNDSQSKHPPDSAEFCSIHEFPRRTPSVTTFTLTQNYRSTQEILDVANWLMDKNPLNGAERLTSSTGHGPLPVLCTFPSLQHEARWIAQDVQRRKADGAPWADHQILLNEEGSPIANVFREAEIPYQLMGGRKLLESAHIRDVLSVLRVIANVSDEISWLRFLPLWPKIGRAGAKKITAAILQQGNLSGAIAILSREPLLAPAAELLRKVAEIQSDVAMAFHAAVESLDQILAHKYASDWEKRRSDWEFIQQLARGHQSTMAFLEQYVLAPVFHSTSTSEDLANAVNITTIHSGSGLQRNVCYIALGWSQSHVCPQPAREQWHLYAALMQATSNVILTRALRGNAGVIQHSRPGRSDAVEEQHCLDEIPETMIQKYVAVPEGETMPDEYGNTEPLGYRMVLQSELDSEATAIALETTLYELRHGGAARSNLTLADLQQLQQTEGLDTSAEVRREGTAEWFPAERLLNDEDGFLFS